MTEFQIRSYTVKIPGNNFNVTLPGKSFEFYLDKIPNSFFTEAHGKGWHFVSPFFSLTGQ